MSVFCFTHRRDCTNLTQSDITPEEENEKEEEKKEERLCNTTGARFFFFSQIKLLAA